MKSRNLAINKINLVATTLDASALKYAVTLILCFILGLAFLFFDVMQVVGNSMNPTLQEGKFLIISHPKNYQHNDLVVFRSPESLTARPPRFIKRLLALSEDSISIQDGQVYLNNQELSESYTLGENNDSFPELLISKGEVIAFEGFALTELPDYLKDTLEMLEPLPKDILGQSQNETVAYTGTLTLKEGFYFVLGDNRSYGASEDSRVFGVISKDSFLGKVLY
jgi:signal peptidase I